MSVVIAANTQVGAVPWLIIGWIVVAAGICSALAIAVDVVRGYRQSMPSMNWVYPITALVTGVRSPSASTSAAAGTCQTDGLGSTA